MKSTRAIAGICAFTAALLASACNTGTSREDIEKKTRDVLAEKTANMVSIRKCGLAEDLYMNACFEKRFYDFDGDMKTVEQYVELYGPRAGANLLHTKRNIVRKGNEPFLYINVYDGKAVKIEEMTPEQMQEFDVEYQELTKRSSMD